jgi:DNA-binding SARP family transcriptional activator/tetratricopeptide (TPR) repeat protein
MAASEHGSHATIRVLGELLIELDGAEVSLPASLRAVALVGWLATHPGARPRSEIASSLWPDVPDASARNSVRSALWSLRQVFGDRADDVLETTRSRIGLCNVSTDLELFDQLVATGHLDDALALCRGELLSGVDDEWALIARDAHRDRLSALLAASSDAAAADDDYVLAIARARKAMELNPLSESSARLLMRRHDEVGDRSVALTIYTRIAERLRRELGIAPSEDTWRLAEAIRTRQHAHLPSAPAVTKGEHRPGHRHPLLIGREHEFAYLESAWQSARSGAGALAVVHGEPGIGKTRLVTELAELAVRAGALTAVGTTSTINRAPYWPWTELAGGLLRGIGGTPPDRPFMAAIAPLLPIQAQPAAPGPPDFEQARLSEGLLDLIEFAAARTPLLLILEDMHWCDDASAAVLARAARRIRTLPVLLVWTRRNRPLPASLAEAEHAAQQSGALAAQLGLEPLGDESISQLVRSIGSLEQAAVEQVVAAADGNALLAVEAARTLARGETSLPQGLRSTVRAASAHLPAQAQTLCAILAVAGRPLSVDEIRRRQPCAKAEFDAAFDAAHDAGLVLIADGMLDFRHALLREAHYTDIPGPLRTRLHASAARAIDEMGEPEFADEAARHLLAAGDREAAADLLVRASQHAVTLGALTRAEELLIEALELKPSNVAITLELAEVTAHRGLAVESKSWFQRALASLDESDDPVAVATAHIRWAEWNTGPLCRPLVAKEAVALALDILDTAGLAAIRLRLEAQAFMALCEAMAGDPATSEELLDAIDAQCGRLPAEPIRDIRRHVARSLAHMRQGRFDEVAESGRAAAEIARSIGRQDLMYGSLVNAAAGLAATGAYAEALQLLDEIGSMPSIGTLPLANEAEVQMSRAWLMSRLDRHAQATRVAHSAQRLAERIGTPDLIANAHAESGRVQLRAGAHAEAADLLALALDVTGAAIGRPMARLQRAEALARSGRLDDARAELAATVLEPVGRSDWPDVLVARMSFVRALLCAEEGDEAGAGRHLEHAAACWRRRIEARDAGERYTAVLADLGRPVIGLISPSDELQTVLTELDHLHTTRETHADIR